MGDGLREWSHSLRAKVIPTVPSSLWPEL
ncbi:unnamed protein product, partial [Linum tenue]